MLRNGQRALVSAFSALSTNSSEQDLAWMLDVGMSSTAGQHPQGSISWLRPSPAPLLTLSSSRRWSKYVTTAHRRAASGLRLHPNSRHHPVRTEARAHGNLCKVDGQRAESLWDEVPACCGFATHTVPEDCIPSCRWGLLPFASCLEDGMAPPSSAFVSLCRHRQACPGTCFIWPIPLGTHGSFVRLGFA